MPHGRLQGVSSGLTWIPPQKDKALRISSLSLLMRH